MTELLDLSLKVLTMAITGGAIYGGIRADMKALRHSVNEAHRRLDKLLISKRL